MRDPGHRFSLSIRTLHGTLHCQTHLISEKETNRYSLASGEVVPDKDCVLAWVPEGNTTLPTVHMVFRWRRGTFLFGDSERTGLPPEHTFPRDVILLLGSLRFHGRTEMGGRQLGSRKVPQRTYRARPV